MKNIPRFLYRYYSRDEYILDALSYRRLYHCQPCDFDDPFDCKPLLSIRPGRSEDEDLWRKYFYYRGRMHQFVEGTSLTEAELMKQADAGLEQIK